MDFHVIDKPGEKNEKYLDLAIELQSLWNTKAEIVPLVLVHWVLYMKKLLNFELFQLTEIMQCLQKTVLLKTDQMLKR